MVVGGHILKAYSSTQSTISLSSAEAELYAMTEAASVATGLVSMAADFGEEWTIKLLGQSAADSLLESGEKAEIIVWLLRRDTDVTNATDSNGVAKYATADLNGSSGILTAGTLLTVNDQFTLQVKPSSGAVLTIQRTVPSRIDAIMDLK